MPFELSERERGACEDVVTNAQAAENFVAGLTFEAIASDKRTNYAVVRCLEIISEASQRLSAKTQQRHPEVDWRDIADAGDFYRHSYHRVALDIVWRTVHERMADIVAACRDELSRLSDP